MQPIDPMVVAEKAMAIIKKGAFLTVRSGDRLNTMTIGWATIGFCWRKPVFMVAVRDSRHTYTLIEDTDNFTVSVPTGNMKDAIMYCGTKSGRDGDKFQALGLQTATAQTVESPIIDTTGIHFECRIVFKSAMDPSNLASDFDRLYPEKDYHTLYFGEITACYEI